MSEGPQDDLGWPLPAAQERAWRRRHARATTLILGLVGLGLLGSVQLAEGRAGLGVPLEGWGSLALWTGPVLLGAPLFGLILTAFLAREARLDAQAWRGVAELLLEPGERPTLLVPVSWLFERAYGRGWLLLSDRRALCIIHRPRRGARGAGGFAWALLCERPHLAGAEVVQRRATRFALVRELLALTAFDRGLRLRTHDGRAWFLACEAELLEHLAARLREEAIPVEVSDDRDLPAAVPVTPLALQPLAARAAR